MADDILKAVNSHLTRKSLLLKRGTVADATIIAAPSSTKNADSERDAEMHQTKKGIPTEISDLYDLLAPPRRRVDGITGSLSPHRATSR